MRILSDRQRSLVLGVDEASRNIVSPLSQIAPADINAMDLFDNLFTTNIIKILIQQDTNDIKILFHQVKDQITFIMIIILYLFHTVGPLYHTLTLQQYVIIIYTFSLGLKYNFIGVY